MDFKGIYKYKLKENVSGATIYEGNLLSNVILTREKHFRKLKSVYRKARPYVEYKIDGATMMEVYLTELDLLKNGKLKKLHYENIDPDPKEFELPKMDIRPLTENVNKRKKRFSPEELKIKEKIRLANYYIKNKEKLLARQKEQRLLKKHLANQKKFNDEKSENLENSFDTFFQNMVTSKP